jgi:hypothetical protein
MATANLPKVLDRPVSHDGEIVASLTGLDRKKVGGRGYRLPDAEETDLVHLVRTGFFRCIKAGNNTPDLQHIIDSVHKGKAKMQLRDAIAKGNAYGTLLVPVLDKEKSPYWAMIIALLRTPEQFGFADLPVLRPDVDIVPTGKDTPDLPAV